MHLAFDARAWTKPPHSFRRVLRLLVDAARGAGWPVELWRTAAFQPGFEAFETVALDASAGTPAGSRAEALWSPQMDVLPAALPTVATIHDVNPLLEDGRGWFARWTRRRKFHRLLRAAAPQVGAYATDTEDARGRIESFFPWLKPGLGVVPLYVESGFINPASARTAAVLARHALSSGYFLFVGSLRRHKNWEGLVRAFARLPDALRREHPLVLVGPAHRAQAEVQRLTRRLGVSGEVRCTGAVEDADLPALYAGARAFVFPSFLEGFGLPPLEAMALGVPVISSNRTCLPEVLGDAPLFIDPAEPADIASAMERLAGDALLHARLTEAGFARSRQFHAARTAEAMRALLNRLPAPGPDTR